MWPFAWVRTVGFAGRKSDRKGEEEWGSGFGLPIVASSACCKGVRSSIEFASLCHGAKAPKWVWAESPDHRSHGGGSPPI